MPALDYITIEGFKSIAAIEKLELRPINLLIGANGSGKSNFIAAFSFLNAIREGRLEDYVIAVGGAERLLHFGSKATERLRLGVSFDDEVNQYRIELRPTELDTLRVFKEAAYFWGDKRRSAQPYRHDLDTGGKEAGISRDLPRVAAYVRGRLESWRTYHFHDAGGASPMKRTASVNDNRAFRVDGANLAPSYTS